MSKANLPRRTGLSLRQFAPIALFVILTLTITYIVWNTEAKHVARQADALFIQTTDNIRSDTVNLMALNALALQGGVGLFRGSVTVTGSEWAEYVDALNFDANFPGVQGMSLNAFVTGEKQRQALETLIRQRDNPDFEIKPPGQRDTYVPVMFLEPSTAANRSALGFDIYSEPLRRAAIEKAIATGAPTLTAPITLVQEAALADTSSPQAGALMIVPIYRSDAATLDPAERRSELKGFVVAVFRMGEVMNAVLERPHASLSADLAIRLWDSTDPDDPVLLYADGRAMDGDRFKATAIAMYGRNWTLETASLAGFAQSGSRFSPAAFAISGVLLSALIAAFAWAQVSRANDSRRAATDMVESNRHIRELMNEVSHRSKNMLGVVSGIARMTVKTSPDDFVAKFTDRIDGLAASQDLLVQSDWKGTSMADLIRSQLVHFEDVIGTRIKVDGPQLQLNAVAAQNLGMALHELCTNAGKYGALSNDTGTVSIAWDIIAEAGAERQLRLSWVETDGPPVVAPETSGFGSTVTGKMAEYGLGAQIERRFDATGLVWQLTCPADEVLV